MPRHWCVLSTQKAPNRLEFRPKSGSAIEIALNSLALRNPNAAGNRELLDDVLFTISLTVPSADELRTGQSRVERLRDIEPEDLLGREPVVLDQAGISQTLQGRCVLVTGAGGSIGSELCRQVARFQPAKLVLYEQSEFNPYTIEQELTESVPALELVRLIGDVKDLAHLRHTFATWQPQVMFHAAAYKHVPLTEDLNAAAALRNNTLGTHHAALAAAEVQAERFVLISTDKAVNPRHGGGVRRKN